MRQLMVIYVHRDMILRKIASLSEGERARQDAAYGGEDNDDALTRAQWVEKFVRQLGFACSDDAENILTEDKRWERQLVRLHALATAALESYYRRRPGLMEKEFQIKEGSGY